MTCPYQLLGLSRTAQLPEVERAYKRIARKLHPDRNPGDPDATAKFQPIQDAYDLLRDPARRARYDQTGDASAPRQDTEATAVAHVLSRCLAGVVQGIIRTGDKPVESDLLGLMKSAIAEALKETRAKRDGLAKSQEALKSLAGRFGIPEGDNLLEDLRTMHLAQIEAEAGNLDTELQRLAKATEVLARYTFKRDKADGLFFPGSWRNLTTTTGLNWMPWEGKR